MICETSYFIALDQDDPDANRLARDNEDAGIPQRIPTIVVLQLYVSVGFGDEPHENARKYEALIANLPVVPLDQNIARRAGVLLGTHRGSAEKPDLGPGDAVIAATGLVYNEPVITSDTDDFGRVEGLDVVTWVDR